MIDRVIGALGGSDRPLDTLANWALVNRLADSEPTFRHPIDSDAIGGLLAELVSSVCQMTDLDSTINMSTSNSFPKRSKVTFLPIASWDRLNRIESSLKTTSVLQISFQFSRSHNMYLNSPLVP